MESYRNPHAASATSLVRDTCLLILRLVCAFSIFFYHGWHEAVGGWHHLWEKTAWPFLDAITGHRFPFPVVSSITIVTVVLLCTVLLVLGLLCRIAAGTLLAFAFVAAPLYLYYPEVTERLGLYSAMFVVILLAGPGGFSADGLLTRKRPPRVRH